jgi:hypothetical protein
MKRPATPELEEHEKNKHQPTPNRAKVQAVFEFNTAYKIKFRKTDIFSFSKLQNRLAGI